MRAFVSIIAANPDGTLAKAADFDTLPEAETHALKYGGFAVANPGGGGLHWAIDMSAKTVVQDEAAENARETISVWNTFRIARNALLASNDWTQGADSPLTDEVKAEWAVHRQLLRDLPENTDDPDVPTWPDAPE